MVLVSTPLSLNSPHNGVYGKAFKIWEYFVLGKILNSSYVSLSNVQKNFQYNNFQYKNSVYVIVKLY